MKTRWSKTEATPSPLDVMVRARCVVGLYALLAMVLIACGNTVSTNDTSASGGSSGAGSATPEICTQFGIELASECASCPVAPLDCECLRGFDIFPREACTFGHCISAIDCDRVCKNFANGLPGPEATQDISSIRECVGMLQRCDSGKDEDCGDGKCVVDPLDGWGRCATGEVSALCKEPTDCQTGLFCVGSTMCTSGNSGDPCDTNDQCLTGTCLTFTRGAEDPILPGDGVCTSGLPNEPCTADEQCIAPTHCVPLTPMRVLGACTLGSESDPCNDDGDCQSGLCVAYDVMPLLQGFCTSGAIQAPCADGSDCATGYCSRSQEPGANFGNCVSGDAGSLCANDQACAGAHCALAPSSGDGICTNGAPGAPCQDDAECASATCIAPSMIESPTCNTLPPGSACENGGVCGTIGGACFLGKCE